MNTNTHDQTEHTKIWQNFTPSAFQDYDQAFTDGDAILELSSSSGVHPRLTLGMVGTIVPDGYGYKPISDAEKIVIIDEFCLPGTKHNQEAIVAVVVNGTKRWIKPRYFKPDANELSRKLQAHEFRKNNEWGYSFGDNDLPIESPHEELARNITRKYISNTPWNGKMGFTVQIAIDQNSKSKGYMRFHVQNEVPYHAVLPILNALNESGLVSIDTQSVQDRVDAEIQQTREWLRSTHSTDWN